MFEWDDLGGGGAAGGGGNAGGGNGGGGGNGANVDQLSFEDSDRFEDDSVCSWISEPESVVNNWRGWRKQSSAQLHGHHAAALAAAASSAAGASTSSETKEVLLRRDMASTVFSLKELASREVAASIPFELVETFDPRRPVPEHLQLRIAYWSFPEDEEDIRLYSCLANGSAEEFGKGEHLFKNRSVKEPLQIGFHLSATVSAGKLVQNTSVTFDRRKIVSCQCSCSSQPEWCAHVVALCLHRIHLPGTVKLRAPVSESLSRLERDQLQKFAQYLIARLPEQILPVAQKILDDLLSQEPTDINAVQGAPDPTLGGEAGEQASFCLDAKNLKDKIKKILVKFCVPAPMVFSDVNYLSTSAPPSASEWCSYLRPLRGREPEGMWNLLSIVREMYRRNDRNSIPLLEIVTQQCLETVQIMIWWFNTKVALQQKHHAKHNVNSNSQASQNACASLCDELVTLWKLAALNPCISPAERDTLRSRLIEYHLTVIEKVQANQGGSNANGVVAGGGNSNRNNSQQQQQQRPGRPSDLELFPGFKPAIEACSLGWSDHPIPGVTYGHNSHYLSPFAVFRLRQDDAHSQHSQVNSSQAVLRCEYPTTSRPRSANNGRNQQQHPAEEPVSDEGVVNDQPADRDGAARGEREKSSASSAKEGQQPLPPLNSQQSSDSTASSSGGSSASSAAAAVAGGEAAAAPKPQLSRVESGTESLNEAEAAALSGERKPDDEEASRIGEEEAAATAADEGRQQDDNDQYRVYYYDPKIPIRGSANGDAAANASGSSGPSVDVFKNLRRTIEDSWEVLFMRAEGIHAHGYHTEACEMAVHLAHDLLKNPPELVLQHHHHNHHHGNFRSGGNANNSSNLNENSKTETTTTTTPGAADSAAAPAQQLQQQPPAAANGGAISKNSKSQHKKSVKAASHQITHTASTTLAHCAFLCTVLSEEPRHRHLAFQVGMFGLELARPPASTKPMEVKLAHQEAELVALLKKIPLGHDEMAVIRDRAQQLTDGTLKSRGEALLPLMLASYIFESLVITPNAGQSQQQHEPPPLFRSPAGPPRADEKLGFEAAVSAIGMKANVSEAEHPLLCEGTRRQRGDLALLLLTHYKDCPVSVASIMRRLLDTEVHSQFKSPILPNYYVCGGGSSGGGGGNRSGQQQHQHQQPQPGGHPGLLQNIFPPNQQQQGAGAGGARNRGNNNGQQVQNLDLQFGNLSLDQPPPPLGQPPPRIAGAAAASNQQQRRNRGAEADWERGAVANPGGAAAAAATGRAGGGPASDSGSSGNSSVGADSGDSSSSCSRQPGQQASAGAGGGASSSAASGSGHAHRGTHGAGGGASPSASAASHHHHHGHPHNNGAIPRYPLMDNFLASVNSVAVAAAQQQQQQLGSLAQQSQHQQQQQQRMDGGMNRLPNMKGARYKGKRQYPSLPNQPSEASAHFMFELAKTVLTKAGGTSSTSLFTQANQNLRGPHRALHMCAFQIGLYALGLHNSVSLNWLSRTYSSHVSWITGQAMELGAAALSFLIGTWEGHLTPIEAADMADKASKSRDAAMVRSGAELALSVLPHAAALNPNGIQRAIQQCKEQRNEMLEKACEAVESAAGGGGVYPEVLFEVARHWHELFKKNQPEESHQQNHPVVAQQQQQQQHDQMQQQPLMQNVAAEVAVAAAANQSLLAAVQVSTAAAAAAGQMPNAPLQVGLPLTVYGILPGFPPTSTALANAALAQAAAAGAAGNNGAVAAAAHQQQMAAAAAAGGAPLMFVTPPPTPQAAAAQAAAALQLQVAAASQPRYPQLYPLGLAAAPLLPAPPPTTPLQAAHAAALLANPPPAQPAQVGTPPQQPLVQQQHQQQHHQQQANVNNANAQKYLVAAYRVAMTALETLGRRISEDRPQARYARTPSYADDVMWLHSISQQLGLAYVENFLDCVFRTIVSPFLLQDLVWDCGKFLASAAAGGLPREAVQYSAVQHQIRTNQLLHLLMKKSQQAYYQCLIQRLFHITPTDHDDFVSVLKAAKQTFYWDGQPQGLHAFGNMLQAIKKNKGCNKELWQKICQSGVQSPMQQQQGGGGAGGPPQ